mgnify:CR=1 FL=1
MITKDEALNTIAAKYGHADWATARYRVNAESLHEMLHEAMEYYYEQSNSHKHSVVRESPPVKEEIDLYLKGQRDTIKLIFDYILGLDEPFGSGGQAQNVSDGLPKRKSFKERLAEEMEKAKIGQPRG